MATKKTPAKPAPKKTAAKAAPAPAPVAEARGGEKIAKTQLIDLLAGKGSLTKKQAAEAVDAVLDVVVDALRSGKSVGLPGLGTFSIAQTAERQGVRPGTSERITIPAGKKVRFKVASTLKSGLGLEGGAE